MGRGRGRGRGGGGRGRGGKDNAFVQAEEKDNADFNDYYQAQGIVPEGEWEAFLETLRKPLPVTFRINGSGRFADHLRDKLQSDFFSQFQKEQLIIDGEPVQAPYPLPWYPNNYAWHINFSRGQLRKMPLLAQIHEFLKKCNEAGSISRQEAVSMVPPLFLDVQPHHKVLDMCAAPGSKTFQLLEALHTPAANGSAPAPSAHGTAGAASGPRPLIDLSPPGFVVANDVDFSRCSLLTHQLKRVCSPHLLVCNHSAEFFPLINDESGHQQRFDRVLCDVPCSGDGTMRKAPDIWRKWGVSNGNGLHILQLRIALHGVQLLEVGGQMVYSTCTFNPIEDEAVVAEMLLRCGDALELLEVSDRLPHLRRLPGKKQWRVRDKYMWYSSWEDAKDVAYKLEPSMFPTPEKAALPLDRCMRFLPHHQDTGGFFVAVLRKVKELPTDFKLPSCYRTAASEAARSDRKAVCAQGEALEEDAGAAPAAPQTAEEMLNATRRAAQAAVEAARESLIALANGDTNEVLSARRRTHSAATQTRRLAGNHRSAQKKEARAAANAAGPSKRAKVEPGAGTAQEAAAVDGDGDVAMNGAEAAEAGDDAMSVGDADQDAAVKQEGDEQEGVAVKAEEEGEENKAEASAPLRTYSWIRGGGGRGRDDGGKHKHIDPVIPVEDPALLQPIQEYFGLDPGFPLLTHIVCRTLDTDRPKRLYLISDRVKEYLLMDTTEQLKIIATGLKVFERQDVKDVDSVLPITSAPGNHELASQCAYRITQEGLPYLLPYVSRQRLYLGVKDFLALLRDRHLPFRLPRDAESPVGVMADPEVVSQLQGVRLGCVVCILRVSDADALGLSTGDEVTDALMANAPMALSAWRGKSSIAIMVDKSETEQMVEKIVAAQKRQEEASGA